jgi:UDP-glucose 4-epimerase
MSPSFASLAERRCVVLGAAGFIGKNLCDGLQSLGARLVGVGRSPDNPCNANEWHCLGLEATDSLEELLQPEDIVFHLASSTTPGSQVTPDIDITTNVSPAVRLFEACSRKRIARVIFLSSGGTVYGPNVQLPTPEDAPTNPISWYGVQKLTIEKYLAVYHRLHALDFITLRVANPFGPHQVKTQQGLVASVIRHALTDTPVPIFGDGLVTRDYIYVADVVEAVLHAAVTAESEAPRIYNVGTGVGRSVLDVISAVQAVHGRPLRVTRLPSRAIDVPASILDISRARKHLGWSPKTDWEQAIRFSYAWAQGQTPKLAQSP